MISSLVGTLIMWVLGAALFKFAVGLMSEHNRHNTLSRALATSAIISVCNGIASVILWPIGGLVSLVIGVGVIKVAYELTIGRVIVVMIVNAILAGLVFGMIGSILR